MQGDQVVLTGRAELLDGHLRERLPAMGLDGLDWTISAAEPQ